MPLTKDL